MTADAIQLPENRCGCVYSLGFATGTYTINSMKVRDGSTHYRALGPQGRGQGATSAGASAL